MYDKIERIFVGSKKECDAKKKQLEDASPEDANPEAEKYTGVKIEKNISAQYGPELVKVEMYMFDKFITGAIANIYITVDDTDGITTQPQIHNSFVGTVIEETTKYMIVEPNEDEIERKSSDRIVINYGTDHIDYLYGIGRKVIINYTGYIMETYPAQINTDNIQIYEAE